MSKARINELSKQITKHRDLYYNEQPEIDDAEFDILCDELRKLDPENDALTAIGADTNSEWEKGTHKIVMGSLDKASTPQELKDWVLKTFKPHNSIFMTEKLDGLSIGITYEDGKLVQALTRGNSKIGEDITRNVIKMGGVKEYIKGLNATLRGEIILKRSNHQKYFSEYSNPRNAASGISKRLDGEGCEHLNVLFYQAVGDTKSLPLGDFESEFHQFEFIESLGLETPAYEAFACGNSKNNLDELCDRVCIAWEDYQTKIRGQRDYLLDGLVIRINDLKDQLDLGFSHSRPRGARAFKFRSEKAKTKIIDITVQVGNSGTLTPVVHIEKTHVGDVDVDKASLYNFDYINELGLDIGAEVIICRAGDVIPRVDALIKGTGTVFQPPTKCPVCSGKVEMLGKKLFCISTDTCPAQKLGRIENWVANLNILEWGSALLQRLVETGKVSTIPDLYKLSINDLMEMERMGAKSAEKCFNLLWAQPAVSLETLLGSLSIPFIGTTMIDIITAAGYDTLDTILELSEEQIRDIKGFGPGKAAALYNGLRRNRKLIDELLSLGIGIKEKEIMKANTNVGGKLAGKKFCFTGEASIGRKELWAMVEENGGEYDKSITKSTTHLVQADPTALSSKTKKAQANGTQIISEEEFFSMCE